MSEGDKTGTLALIVDFLNGIGLEVRRAAIDRPTFLPGITIEHGALLYDESKLLYVGDLLHEAGHLAVIPSEERRRAQGDVGKKAGEEMMAIAWSYAAALHLGLDPSVVFHDGGYRGSSRALIENFAKRRYIGVSLLQWLGLTADGMRALELGVDPYPNMIRWLVL